MVQNPTHIVILSQPSLSAPLVIYSLLFFHGNHSSWHLSLSFSLSVFLFLPLPLLLLWISVKSWFFSSVGHRKCRNESQLDGPDQSRMQIRRIDKKKWNLSKTSLPTIFLSKPDIHPKGEPQEFEWEGHLGPNPSITNGSSFAYDLLGIFSTKKSYNGFSGLPSATCVVRGKLLQSQRLLF